MLRRFLDYQLSLTEPGKPLHFVRPLVTAGDTFLFEAPINTKTHPHIRDAIDVKRWMIIVVYALIPCIMMAIWNTGLQKIVYSSGDYHMMDQFLAASNTWNGYWDFVGKDWLWMSVIKEGLIALMPIVLISYVVGGIWEAIFAIFRGHEISEGFLVTGILYALILPPTIPYWMVALGVSFGIIFSKEVFGGSGMNIVNPALTCRAILFFGFPGRMSGTVWAGTDLPVVRESLLKMNKDAGKSTLDGYTQATKLSEFNVTPDIKRVHIDAIATNDLDSQVSTYSTINQQFEVWKNHGHEDATLGQLTQEQLREFVTTPNVDGGLGLSSGFYDDAYHFSALNYGLGDNGDWAFFLGNKLGSLGETSVLACLIGAAMLIWSGVGSWRIMLSMTLGAYLTALFFELGSSWLASDGGAWTPAQFGFPAYKHLLLGGLAFGIVFMATDPVSSPAMNSAKWVYGIFCGLLTIVIRAINPAYPEGVMLAILMGNVFAPLFDYYAAKLYRKRRVPRVAAA